ncbi:MAG: MerR family transcriptional regulator [Anaerovoracaceae bacterium]
MKKNDLRFSISQFAKLHNVNKRTLHYYDEIGLFAPAQKDPNGYRYYTPTQSIEFEYILMLKELNMQIKEIDEYLQHPNPDDFIKIVDVKTKEIDKQVKRLNSIKKNLLEKKEKLKLCTNVNFEEIELIYLPNAEFISIPFDFDEENMANIFTYVKDTLGLAQWRGGIGSYISVDKLNNGDFENYDGLFAPAPKKVADSQLLTREAGQYLRCYYKGDWDGLPKMYQHLLDFARDNNLTPTGYSYEVGMNTFAISNIDEYVTQIIMGVSSTFLHK